MLLIVTDRTHKYYKCVFEICEQIDEDYYRCQTRNIDDNGTTIKQVEISMDSCAYLPQTPGELISTTQNLCLLGLDFIKLSEHQIELSTQDSVVMEIPANTNSQEVDVVFDALTNNTIEGNLLQ